MTGTLSRLAATAGTEQRHRPPICDTPATQVINRGMSLDSLAATACRPASTPLNGVHTRHHAHLVDPPGAEHDGLAIPACFNEVGHAAIG
jgi:hypothetical protein